MQLERQGMQATPSAQALGGHGGTEQAQAQAACCEAKVWWQQQQHRAAPPGLARKLVRKVSMFRQLARSSGLGSSTRPTIGWMMWKVNVPN